MASVVPLGHVLVHEEPIMSDVRKQGQIEPLQVKLVGSSTFMTFRRDLWGAAIVRAARTLDWPTILITIEKRYIP